MRGTSYEGAPPPSSTPDGNKERRVALVIGNSAYPTAPLRNPRNDAEAFAAQLQALQPPFDVTIALDVGRDAMEDALETFEAKLANSDTGLLFFAGHGLQVKGTNFLMPVDADIRQEIHLRRRAFSLNEVLDIMGRRVRLSSLVFLDACRENPFVRSLVAGMPQEERGRFLTRSGLAEVRASSGSFVAFATAPDNVALDGAAANSPFTAALVEHMTTPGASINDVMIAVRRDVLKATGGRQEPWDQSSLRERFCFSAMPAVEEPATQDTAQPLQPRDPVFAMDERAFLERAALEHWKSIKGTTDPARLLTFIADYGTTRMGVLAREAMQRLATVAWRKVSRRNESALQRFIAEYPAAAEVAEAGAVLVALQAGTTKAGQADTYTHGAHRADRTTFYSTIPGLVIILAGIAFIVVERMNIIASPHLAFAALSIAVGVTLIGWAFGLRRRQAIWSVVGGLYLILGFCFYEIYTLVEVLGISIRLEWPVLIALGIAQLFLGATARANRVSAFFVFSGGLVIAALFLLTSNLGGTALGLHFICLGVAVLLEGRGSPDRRIAS